MPELGASSSFTLKRRYAKPVSSYYYLPRCLGLMFDKEEFIFKLCLYKIVERDIFSNNDLDM